MCSHGYRFMHEAGANHQHYGGQKSPDAIYNPVTLTWQPDQIVTWQPDQRMRKAGNMKGFYILGEI
jgi:hypothetical protein